MHKRIFVIMMVLAIIASLSISVSALAAVVGEENIAKVKDMINQERNDIRNLVDNPKEMNEVARFEKTSATDVSKQQVTVTFVEGNDGEIQDIVVETTETEDEITVEETIPEETQSVETEPVEAEEKEKEETIEERLRIVLVETQEDDTRIYKFKGSLYAVPDIIVNEEPRVTDSGYVEKIYNVPQYFQQSYPKTQYGNHGTISSHGCGIASVAMVFTYLLDREIMPDELAAEYGRFNTEHGSDHALFETSAKDYGLEVTTTYLWQDVVEALKKGCVVISNVRNNLFTDGGHFIVYHGITEDGKILVRDPSIYNFAKNILDDGFANGFEEKYVKYSFPCWIYSPKDLDAIAEAASETNAN